MDLYEILGVRRGAGGDEIRRAYRRLARRYHPDINPGDREAQVRYAQITRAFETLSDPERRRAYDAGGAAEVATPPPAAYGFEGFDFSVQVVGQDASTFGELFADVLTRTATAGGSAPQPGAHLHAALSVTLDEVMAGATRAVPVTRYVPCRGCQGRGIVQVAARDCAACGGTGRIRSSRGHMVFGRLCERCGGSGVLTAATCRACGGQGLEVRGESVEVAVPPGVEDGAELRVAGRGHAGRRGGEAGDLFVRVHVEAHPFFRREGPDLHLVLPVAVHEAALGARIQVPTPDGAVALRIPPGTQSGARLRLRERGVPDRRRGVRGDLIVEVQLVLPSLLDERSKELLREFARANTEDVRREWWARSAGRRTEGGGKAW
jgi:molecular chaperone DnaJ